MGGGISSPFSFDLMQIIVTYWSHPNINLPLQSEFVKNNYNSGYPSFYGNVWRIGLTVHFGMKQRPSESWIVFEEETAE